MKRKVKLGDNEITIIGNDNWTLSKEDELTLYYFLLDNIDNYVKTHSNMLKNNVGICHLIKEYLNLEIGTFNTENAEAYTFNGGTFKLLIPELYKYRSKTNIYLWNTLIERKAALGLAIEELENELNYEIPKENM